MEGYNLTTDVFKKAKSYGMKDERYLIYADLRAVGWSITNAWNIAFNGIGSNWDAATRKREQNHLESLGSVQKRIEEVKGERTMEKEDLTPEELAKETSKEKILKDLVIARRRYKEGSKEWTEQTKLIAEYSRIKQDDIQVEDTTVHSFLPVNYPTCCDDCLIFKNGKAKLKPKSKG